MVLADKFRKLARLAQDFIADRKGNIAMIFGIAVIPMTIAAGVGLDTARSMIVKTALTEALDAAALAVGSTPGLTQAQMQTQAQNFFNANYRVDSTYGTPLAVTVTPNGQQVTVSTSVQMPTTLMNIAGISSVNVTSSSTVVWGQTKIWVSLVLDNTGSMCESDTNPNAGSPCPTPSSGSKIAQLKSATHNLLTLLQGAATNAGDVKVALVPFVKDVNVGTGNVNATWLDWSYYGSCNISGIKNQTTCTTTHGTWTSSFFGGGSCNISGYNTKTSCQNATGTWTPGNKNNWNGCVTDRGNSGGPDTTNNYDVMNTSPSAASASLFTVEQYSSCPQSLLALGYDWTALSNKVDAMSAGGSTNQTIGLVWGWHALSVGTPLSAGSLPANTARYIIILSDGLNTQDRWYGNGSSQSTQVDDRMALVCTNAKADGIVIYAVFVDIGGTQGNSSVLQNCASDASKYYDLTSASQISATFAAIGQQITNLRVSL